MRPASRGSGSHFQVGISAFLLLGFVGPDGEALNLETRHWYREPRCGQKNNMSCIIRIFYEYQNETFPELLGKFSGITRKSSIEEARLKANFSYPMLQESLRSGFVG